MEPNDNVTPFFILCGSRTGSTLLRYVIDAHPRACCPPELHLCILAKQLYYVYELTGGSDSSTSKADKPNVLSRKVRMLLDGLMGEYTERENKTMWCEKSIFTIDHIARTKLTFPDARYICLYRNCLDQVKSAMETLKQYPTGKEYGLDPFLKKAHPNKLNGLTDYWIDKTHAILKFEREHPKQTIRINYESLVTDSGPTIERLLKFMGLEWDSTLLDSIFSSPHQKGPGDHKIYHTFKILPDSIGGGNDLPVGQISATRLKRVNELHKRLGYRKIKFGQQTA